MMKIGQSSTSTARVPAAFPAVPRPNASQPASGTGEGATRPEPEAPPRLTSADIARVASTTPAPTSMPSWAASAAGLPTSYLISGTITAAGAAATYALLHLPPLAAVASIYFNAGGMIGAFWPQLAAGAQRARPRLSRPEDRAPKVMVGHVARDERGAFLGADVIVAANAAEWAGRSSDARRYAVSGSAALDEWRVARRITPADLQRLASSSNEALHDMQQASKLGSRELAKLVTDLRSPGANAQPIDVLARFLAKNGARGLAAVYASVDRRTLGAQNALTEHLSKTYGPDVAAAVVAAIADKGRAPGIQHPSTTAVAVSPEVTAELARMASEPGSGVELDDRQRPMLVDPRKGPEVLVRLAGAEPARKGLDCALLVDDDRRIYFGTNHGHAVDAISAAMMLAGTGRKETRADKRDADFDHSNSTVWTLGTTDVGLRAAKWANFKEVRPLTGEAWANASAVPEGAPVWTPSAGETVAFAGLSQKAEAIVAGRPEPLPSAGQAAPATEVRWPTEGRLPLDAALLRGAEAFVRAVEKQSTRTHGQPAARVTEDGQLVIGGPGSGLSPDEARKICADLALTLSAVARTDSGQEPGGPFGTVVWDSKSGVATVGKNQVVPGRSASLHGEVVGLLLRPEQDNLEVFTSAETCDMCFATCNNRKVDIYFVASTADVERETPFTEGSKDYTRAAGRVFGSVRYADTQGRELVSKLNWLADRAPIASKILRDHTENGTNYAFDALPRA